jgi:methylenetetrahydrofolate dehydrogenase (NADP+)/methenyltetrahydrofolate cyclohydrolase
MPAQIIDGKQIAGRLLDELQRRVVSHIERTGQVPCLAAVLVGNDPASEVYVRSKRRTCERVGMVSRLIRLQADEGHSRLADIVGELNEDTAVHGILVQLPLPENFDSESILDAVHPLKDVDAFHPENVGRIMQGRPRLLPCTPHGVLQILYHSRIKTAGRDVVVVGRSDIVGKPMAMMLAQRTSPFGPEWANATVTLCHSRTPNLSDHTRRADILIAAVGQPHVITAEMIKPGAAVIDVGINRTEEGLVGDVEFETVQHVAGHLTPVPGGVGPLTIAMLLHNTLIAAELQLPRH